MSWIQKIVAKIGMDKIAHFAVSAFITLAIGRFLHWTIAAGIALCLGVAKEVLDGTIDNKDLLVDALGVLLGVVILII